MDIGGISIGLFDLVAIGIMLFFMVLGLFKGFVFQVVRLCTFLVALGVAKTYSGTVEAGSESGLAHYLLTWFPNQFDSPDSRKYAVYIAFFLLFLGVFILGTILAFMLRSLLKRLELRSFDKILGGLLGIAVGAICVVVIVSIIVSVSPDSELVNKINDSHSLKLSTKVIQFSKPFFPESLRSKIEEILNNMDQDPPAGEEEKKE